MVDAKVSNPMQKLEYYFINRVVRQVNTEEDAVGHQIKHHPSHNQYVLFRDEVYTDTNQMDDGSNRGQHYISIKRTKTNLLSSKASGCFTLMGMNSATGEPVLCKCILATKSLIVTDFKGFYYCMSIPYDSSKTMEENMGEGKALPGLTVFRFRRKSIPGLM